MLRFVNRALGGRLSDVARTGSRDQATQHRGVAAVAYASGGPTPALGTGNVPLGREVEL
jgi:hypothetical protein